MDIGGRVASGTATEKMSGTNIRNTDAHMDVGSRKHMEQVFEKTKGISFQVPQIKFISDPIYITIQKSIFACDKHISYDGY